MLNPVSTLLRLTRLRINSPAPTIRTSDSATCETTSALASGLFVPGPCGPRPPFNVSVSSTRRTKSRHRAKDYGGHDSDGNREEQQTWVDGDIERNSVSPGGDHAEQNAIGDGSECDAECTARQCKHQTFGEKLTDETCPARSESLADGEFASARRRSSEQQVRDVGARDEQN